MKKSTIFIKQTAKDYDVSVDIVKELLKRLNNDNIKMYLELENIVKERK